MKKSFEEMTFDELKLYCREGLWRSLSILLVAIVVIICMIVMTVNHVSQSNLYRFRTLGIVIILALLGYLRTIANANKVMREHPDWIRKSGMGAHIPLPREWHLKRALVIGIALTAVIIGFIAYYHPQHTTTDIPDISTSSSLMNPMIQVCILHKCNEY
ncbi:hypothetical protein MK541_04670 [Streptococcus gallolyticus subsp. gallolyticus]|uniref:hypothetical protein n=1 Tax=Streptococcus gallolyticus TaxID=315405 RepID=UPI00228459E6|nr:hypothetical protein [Streptococcus gallolyticus]MCY7151470.1 hypothetical protein [Streptococcus gallolyticus subsp. gallolyticus]